MLTTAEARRIADQWQPRFADVEAYVTSVERYLTRVPGPSRSSIGLEQWLAADCEQQDVRGVLLTVRPPQAGPELVPQQLPDLVDDCSACRGKRWVTRELPPGHAEFGKALVCPACGGRPTRAAVDSASAEPVNRCSKCGVLQSEWALERCGNPKWHDPNWQSGQYPHERPVPGWTTPGEQLARRAEPAA